MRLLRVGHSNSRVTYNKVYVVEDELYIRDDKGKKMQPCILKKSRTFDRADRYWKILPENKKYKEPIWLNPAEEHQPCPKQFRVEIEAPYIGIDLAKEETIMLTIENKILINGRDVEDITTDRLVQYIQDEEQNIENLGKLKVKSTAVEKLKDKHTNNISKIVKILDKREV